MEIKRINFSKKRRHEFKDVDNSTNIMNPKVILASASPQRRKLLKLAGIKFSVHPSHADEETRIKTTCSALVKHNALLKAKSLAAKMKAGIIIGADTVVYAGKGQLIGKPKDLNDAKRILKILFSRPQWVYTGVAIIDARTGKTCVDYEKTRVFMHKLSNEEIDRYHSSSSPLDKAGGFDIEGRGGFFINRIEGCYSNVIGLPLAKLRVMLKHFGISILSLLLCVVFFSGCTTEYNLATEQEETLLYGTEKEVQMGDAMSQQLEKELEIDTDVDINERAQRVLSRIAAVCDRKELVYTIKVINDEDTVNAVSLPGGYIYVYKGLIDRIKSDDELAGVIGHEVGHVNARHAIKRLQAMYGYSFLQVLSVASGNSNLAVGTSAIFTSVFFAYSRQDEFQADKLGLKYMAKAGYDPKKMLDVLEILHHEQQKAPLQRIGYFRTHPYLPERIAVVNREIAGQIDFRSYLNLTGSEDDPRNN